MIRYLINFVCIKEWKMLMQILTNKYFTGAIVAVLVVGMSVFRMEVPFSFGWVILAVLGYMAGYDLKGYFKVRKEHIKIFCV